MYLGIRLVGASLGLVYIDDKHLYIYIYIYIYILFFYTYVNINTISILETTTNIIVLIIGFGHLVWASLGLAWASVAWLGQAMAWYIGWQGFVCIYIYICLYLC